MKSPKCAPNSTPSNSSSSRKVQLAIGKYLSQLGWLDPRSLACFRLILSLVLLYDIGQSWTLIDDWVGLQGYYDGLPLPGLIGIRGSWIGITDETTLRLIFSVYAVSVLGLLVGYETSWCTIWVWVASCGHHYAASHTLDYHDTAIVNLLLWSLALPLGDRFSVDAVLRRKAGHRFTRSPKDITPAPKDITPARQLRQRRLVEAVAGCGFVLTLAWLYLNTAAAKDGAAWWSQGDAVRLAVMEFSARAPEGVWAIAHLPDLFFRVATHLVLVVEWVVPFLLLSPWKRSVLRTACCATLIGLHVVMWLLLDIGSFPRP